MKILLLNHTLEEVVIGDFGVRFHWQYVPKTESLLGEITWRHLSERDSKSHPLTRRMTDDLTDQDLFQFSEAIFVAYKWEMDAELYDTKEQVMARILEGILDANRKMTKEAVTLVMPKDAVTPSQAE